MGRLLIVFLKMTFRDKQALFWTLLFPCMFIIIFGLFNFDNPGNAKIAVIDQANSEISQQFVAGLEKIDFLKIESSDNVDSSKDLLKNDKLEFVLVIPESFNINLPAANPTKQAPVQAPVPSSIQVYYNEANSTTNPVILGIIEKFVYETNFAATQTQKLFTLESEGVAAKKIKYLDMLTPGIMAMAVMSAAIIGISSEIVKYREQKLLKRLTATPLKVRDFLMAEVFSYLILAVIQLTLIVLLAHFAYHVKFYGNIFILYGLSLIGSLIFLNIGFAIAGVARSVNAAEAMSQVIFMPMMFLSGVFFPVEALPNAVYHVVQFLPLTPLIEALRSVSIYNAPLSDITKQLLLLAGWIIVSFLIAWKSFRFDKQKG
jgi:ABC-2 type transport system permease protein